MALVDVRARVAPFVALGIVARPIEACSRTHRTQLLQRAWGFGLSIHTTERDLDDEFSRFGRVEKVTIVYDQRSDRSHGFGFIKMSTVEEATRCIVELNGVDLNGRRIRVDYSVTDSYSRRVHGAQAILEQGFVLWPRSSRREGLPRPRLPSWWTDCDRDWDPCGRDSRDWHDRRSSPPRRHLPEYRRHRSYSRSLLEVAARAVLESTMEHRLLSPMEGLTSLAGKELDTELPRYCFPWCSVKPKGAGQCEDTGKCQMTSRGEECRNGRSSCKSNSSVKFLSFSCAAFCLDSIQ